MNKLMFPIIYLLFFLAVPVSVFSTSSNPDYDEIASEVRGTLQAALAKGGTSVSYAIIQNEELLMADAVGYLNGAKKDESTVDTLYNIGSLSKVYTSAAVMKLVDNGEFNLDDPVVNHLPNFRLKDSRYNDITIRMLLNHSSGMLGTDYTTGIIYGGYDKYYYDKIRAYFAKSVLKADPGAFSVYCNDGFEVAELLVAKVSGMHFDKFVDENIFTPMRLTSAGYANRTFIPGSYAVEGSLPQEFPNVMGSGGISTNLIDLARFGTLFLTGGAGVLQPSSVSEMDRSQGKTFIAEDTSSINFGLGWDNVNSTHEDFDFGPGVLWKSGGTTQFTSYLYVIPAYNISASISVTSDFSGDADTTLREIIAKVLRVQGVETSRPAIVYTPLQQKPLPLDFTNDYQGYYGFNSSLWKMVVNDDQTITLMQFKEGTWDAKFESLAFDGDVFCNPNGEKICRFVQAMGSHYLLIVSEKQNIAQPSAQKLESTFTPLGAWNKRLNKLYLPAEVDYKAIYLMSGLKLMRIEDLDGIIFMQQNGGEVPLSVLDDRNTGLVLNIVRDLNTLTVKRVNGEEWLENEAYALRPASSLKEVESGVITIPRNGKNYLYRLPSNELRFTIPKKGRVIAYNNSGDQIYDSLSQGVNFSLLPKEGFIRFSGPPNSRFILSNNRGHSRGDSFHKKDYLSR